jgi:hypothetical protein
VRQLRILPSRRGIVGEIGDPVNAKCFPTLMGGRPGM